MPLSGMAFVRGREHDAEVGVHVGRQEGHRRRGQHAGVIDARRGEPGNDGRREELPDARVPSDDGLRLATHGRAG